MAFNLWKNRGPLKTANPDLFIRFIYWVFLAVPISKILVLLDHLLKMFGHLLSCQFTLLKSVFHCIGCDIPSKKGSYYLWQSIPTCTKKRKWPFIRLLSEEGPGIPSKFFLFVFVWVGGVWNVISLAQFQKLSVMGLGCLNVNDATNGSDQTRLGSIVSMDMNLDW